MLRLAKKTRLVYAYTEICDQRRYLYGTVTSGPIIAVHVVRHFTHTDPIENISRYRDFVVEPISLIRHSKSHFAP